MGDDTDMDLDESVQAETGKTKSDLDIESGVNDALNNFESLEKTADGKQYHIIWI
jgi:hypothetical protein